MARQWTVSYYIATRFGSMQERTRAYSSDLSRLEVERKITNFLDQEKRKGTAVYPQYDVQLEVVA